MTVYNEDTYTQRFNVTKERLLNEFDEFSQNTGDLNYSITVFTRRLLERRDAIDKGSGLQSKISEMRNEMILNNKTKLTDLIGDYCKKTKKNILKTIEQIADIDASNCAYSIIDRKRPNHGKSSYYDSPIHADKMEKLSAQSILVGKTEQKKLSPPKILLEDLMKDRDQFPKRMKPFVDRDLCAENTYIWKASKQLLVAVIYELHHKGWLKKKPSYKDIISISSSTFGTRLSRQTVINGHGLPIPDHISSLIPPYKSI